MTWLQILGLVLALLVMLVGVAGSILPGIPGPPLVLGAAVVHRLCFGEAGASGLVLGLLLGLTLLSLSLDYLATLYGARKMGATKLGVIGAGLGVVIGLFFGFPGVVAGPFIGAMALEMFGGREWRDAGRAGFGATLGLLAGAVGKLACCLAMMGLFTIHVMMRSLMLPS